MSENAIITTLTEEKIQLGREVTEAKAATATMTGRAELAEAKLETTKALLEKYQSLGSPEDLKSMSENFNEVNTAKLTLEGQVVAYKYLGTPEEIEESMNLLESLKALGTPEQLTKCMDVLESYMKIGKPATVQALAESLAKFEELGTADEIAEAMDAAKDAIKVYEELGTVGEIDEALNALAQYIELGSPTDIQEALTRSLNLVKSIKSDKAKAKNESLAAELKVPVAIIESLGDKSEEEIRSLVTAISGGKAPTSVSERYRVEDTPAGKGKVDEDQNRQPDQNNDQSAMNESRSSRLMDRFSM